MTDEQHRWLRGARPDTSADDGWAASADGDRALAAIHAAAVATPARPVGWRRPAVRFGLPAVLAAGAAAALVIGTTGGPSNPGTKPIAQHPPAGIGPVPANMELAAYDSCGQLLASLRKNVEQRVTYYGLQGQYYGYYGDDLAFRGSALNSAPIGAAAGYFATSTARLPQAASADLDKATGTPSYSTTNNQEKAADEPDVVKTDGKRIVSISSGVLRVVDASTHKLTGSLDLTVYAGASNAQILMSGDHVLVLLGSSYTDYYWRDANSNSKASSLLVDIAKTPRVVGTLQTGGRSVDARMVGSTV